MIWALIWWQLAAMDVVEGVSAPVPSTPFYLHLGADRLVLDMDAVFLGSS